MKTIRIIDQVTGMIKVIDVDYFTNQYAHARGVIYRAFRSDAYGMVYKLYV